jgi:quinoprotein dehydrogenase-associated probable ABC transporter substrate-binding protein
MTKLSTAIKYLIITSIALLTFDSQAQDKFRVCADPLHPPYSSKDLSGYENKIAALFAQQLGQEIEYYWFPDRMAFIRNTLKAENDNGEGFKCDVVMGLPAGSDIAATTDSYLHSSYVLLIAKGRGWDDISATTQLQNLPTSKQEKLKIAMFDRGPGTDWLQRNGLLEQGVPYQTMTGDNEHNTAMQIENDLQNGKIDMVILWGPLAGYIQTHNPNAYTAIPMQSTADLRFDFSIAMAVRQGDNKRKQQLNELIAKNQAQIHDIISSYGIIMLPIEKKTGKQVD